MLFSKLKAKDEELLPPPPPFPGMELEEEKPVSGEIKPKKAAEGDGEFENLLREVEGLSERKTGKKVKLPAKRELRKISKKPIKAIKIKPKPLKAKKALEIKPIKKAPKQRIALKKQIQAIKKISKPIKLPKIELEPFEKEIEAPEPGEAIELPETLDQLGTEDILKDLETEKEMGFEKEFKPTAAKPIEIQEAEEEIQSAIERIKKQEEPSLFKRLFAKERIEEKEQLMPVIGGADDVSKVQWHITKARDALMKFDLEAAKRNYIEAMRIYNRVSPEQQAKVYNEIRELYFERKSAEELKV